MLKSIRNLFTLKRSKKKNNTRSKKSKTMSTRSKTKSNKQKCRKKVQNVLYTKKTNAVKH